MISTFGWGRGPTAAALSIQRIQGGMVSPFVGTLLNRYGPRKVMSFGVAVTGLSFVLMSQVQTLWQFYLVIILLTIGMSFGTFIVLVVSVGNWFIRRRALALGILMSTSGFGGLTLPLLNNLVEDFGWRDVMFAIGIGFWIVGFAATFVMRGPPENYGLLPDGDMPEVDDTDEEQKATAGRSTKRLRHPREVAISTRDSLKMRFFWQLAIASSLGQFVSASNLTHIEALKNYGISGAAAASAVGAVAVGDVLGRAGVAFLGDRMNKRLLLTASFGIEALGILAIGVVNTTIFGISLGHFPVPVYSIAFGLGFGGSVPLRLALLADYFGRRNYGSIVGLTSSVNAVFGASGAAFAGFMFDVTGSYRLPFSIMAVMLFLAVPMTLALESQGRVAARTRYARRRLPQDAARTAPSGGDK